MTVDDNGMEDPGAELIVSQGIVWEIPIGNDASCVSREEKCQHVDFSGSAIWAMIIMIIILTIVMVFFCMVNCQMLTTMIVMVTLITRVMVTLMMMVMAQVPVYKALEKRWNHWDDLENDPRSFHLFFSLSNCCSVDATQIKHNMFP